ncbi:DNA-deoxyinosine glycosylase [Proteiniclasticum ruminis]
MYNKYSTTLILGSFPSVKSRASMFYYAHPQNRFWRILPRIYNNHQTLETNEEKSQFLLEHRIALWDVLHSCTIEGSSDSSIKDAVPNDLTFLLENSDIRRILCNGTTAYKLFQKFQKFDLEKSVEVLQLPSTSPANARFSEETLEKIWKEALLHHK